MVHTFEAGFSYLFQILKIVNLSRHYYGKVSVKGFVKHLSGIYLYDLKTRCKEHFKNL